MGTNKGTENGHEYVDLGLPSGTLWATCNVGADKPEDYGDHFAWGETLPKSDDSWENYKWCNVNEDRTVTLTKYNTLSEYGAVDNKTILEFADDAAAVNCGGAWRTPTDEEWKELLEECTWTWTTLNRIKGYEVTSKTNGNSIFLPAAGYPDIHGLTLAGINGYYWSGSLDTDFPGGALFVRFESGDVGRYGNYRCHDFSIRPVLTKE